MADLQFLRPGAPAPQLTDTFEQERREVLDSVMSAFSSAVPDADQMDACAHLLRHLSAAAPRRAA